MKPDGARTRTCRFSPRVHIERDRPREAPNPCAPTYASARFGASQRAIDSTSTPLRAA